MKTTLSIWFLFLLTACGEVKTPIDYIPEDPAAPFRGCLQEFTWDSGHYVNYYDIAFGSAANYGTCSNNQIRINKAMWPADTNLQEEIVFHYLGMCVLGRAEESGTDSIMNINLVPVDKYVANKTHYINQLVYGDTPIPTAPPFPTTIPLPTETK